MAAGAQRDQNLELARLHIDLLEVLQQKTAGNLDSQIVLVSDGDLGRPHHGPAAVGELAVRGEVVVELPSGQERLDHAADLGHLEQALAVLSSPPPDPSRTGATAARLCYTPVSN